MDLADALRLIAAKSPNNVQNAVRALRTAQYRPDAHIVQYVLEQALIDPLTDFTAEERGGIAALLSGTPDEQRTLDIRVRVSANEKALVQQWASAAGLTVSNYVRQQLGLLLVAP